MAETKTNTPVAKAESKAGTVNDWPALRFKNCGEAETTSMACIIEEILMSKKYRNSDLTSVEGIPQEHYRRLIIQNRSPELFVDFAANGYRAYVADLKEKRAFQETQRVDGLQIPDSFK